MSRIGEGLSYPLSFQEVIEILRIVDTAPGGHELRLELGDLKITVRKDAPAGSRAEGGDGGNAGPTESGGLVEATDARVDAARPRAVGGRAAPPRLAPDGAVQVKAPLVGTFYRAPAPGAAPFIEVGSRVEPDDTVCIVEVMKLMNEVRAGCKGRVLEIWARDGALVEYGETLVLIEPTP